MKPKLLANIVVPALLSTIGIQYTTAFAQSTAFSYQGQLLASGVPANGAYDLQFALFPTNQFGSPLAPILTNLDVPVINGLFTTTLDFGNGVFSGANFWIELGVRPQITELNRCLEALEKIVLRENRYERNIDSSLK